LMDYAVNKGVELSRKKEEVSKLNTKMAVQSWKIRKMENYLTEKETKEKNLEDAASRAKEEAKKTGLELAKKTREASITAKKLELTKKGYNDRLEYICRADPARNYLFLKAIPRKTGSSDEKNMKNFEIIYAAACSLDRLFEADYERADISALINGKSENKIENSKFTNTYENKNFELYTEGPNNELEHAMRIISAAYNRLKNK